MVEAATEFKKSGYTEEEAATLAQVAAMYQNIADTEVSAADASATIISALKAFNYTAGDAINVISSYNEVANNFAVGTNDLSSALEIAGAGMAVYGNEFEEVIGLVTAGTEIMTGRSSQVARGLMAVAQRITTNQDLLRSYGVTVEDANGNLKSTYDVLKELKPIWDNMTDAERTSVGTALAG